MAEEQQGQESVFNSRADSAAMALKGQLSQSLGIDLPSRQVPVGEDGQPVGQPPPEGSYARQIAQQHAHMQAQARQQVQGDQAQEAVQHAPPQQQTPDTTPRTQERIETLISKLNDKDRELGELRQQQATHATTHQQLQAQLQERDAQMQNMLKEHMENLDPETRAQIMTDARIKQAMDVSEQRILSILGPQLRTLQGNAAQAEKAKLSDMFPGVYNPQRHDELIDAFRRENPKSSMRMAFQAILTPEEMRSGGGPPRTAAPPAVPPGSGPSTPRYMPNPAGQSGDPVKQMVEDANKAAELARSTNPQDRKMADALFHKNLSDRLGLTAPR
jgi:hypothetical protein